MSANGFGVIRVDSGYLCQKCGEEAQVSRFKDTKLFPTGWAFLVIPKCMCFMRADRGEQFRPDSLPARVHAEAPGGGEIEVTPEMIEAGDAVVYADVYDFCVAADVETFSARIYIAMERARRGEKA